MAMHIEYQQFLQMLAEEHKFTKDEYYSHILTSYNHILVDIRERGQKLVAADLNIPQPKLSNIVHILEALCKPSLEFSTTIMHSTTFSILHKQLDEVEHSIGHETRTLYCLLKGKGMTDWRCYGDKL